MSLRPGPPATRVRVSALPSGCTAALVCLALAGCAAPKAADPDTPAPEETFDVERVQLAPGRAEIRFRVWAGDAPAAAWRAPLVLRSDAPPLAVWLEQGALSVLETQGDLVRVTPSRPVEGAVHVIEVQFEEGAVRRIGPADAADRVELVLLDAHDDPAGVRGRAVPASADLSALGEAPPEPTVAFAQFCERTLLSRFPAEAADAPAHPAAHWFGNLVAPAPGPDGVAIAALPTVLVRLFADEAATADRGREDLVRALHGAGGHVERLDDAWAVARHLALRDHIGAEAYREVLRRLVLEHSGGAPVDLEAFALAVQDVGGDAGAAYARAWLAGPGRPTVKSQWRYDGQRKRVLVRVDQTHAIEGDEPRAYPFTLPVRIMTESGSLEDHDLRIERRRSLLEVPAETEPLALTIDPDGVLAGRVDFAPED